MTTFLQLFGSYWWVLALVAFVVCYKLTFRLFGIVIVPEETMGIVNKKFVVMGNNRTLPNGAIIALNGEAGFQADTLAPGLHFGYFPWQYEIKMEEFTTVPEGKVGVVEARDGLPVTKGRVLGQHVDCNTFQDARAFLTQGGQRGPQMSIIPPGTYRINTAIFSVVTEPARMIGDNMVGIVTTQDGKALETGEIAGKEVAGHKMFQDGEAFISAGGYKGRQEQVILAGRYYINPRFATVEEKPMTEVPIAHVGVVIAYVGEAGQDVSGEEFKHGNLVKKGQKGVWADPYDPGKYPINPYTHKVECVPTANVVLNWANDKTESHKLDERLSSITVRSSDGFKYPMDISQIIHIPRNDAPKVIARFGSVANLVTQVLEPTIGNYFRNAAQKADVIQFLSERSIRQEEAKKAIQGALMEYNVGAVDTLIGDIVPPEELMKTLTDRKIAQQQQITYETERTAEETRKALEQAKAQANTQSSVVTAERSVEIAKFNAEAAVKKAEGDAESKKINAKADAEVTTVNGAAEAGKTQAIGDAEASVIEKKTKATGQGNYALMEVTRSLSANRMQLVPQIVAGGSGDKSSGGSSLIDVLMANLLRDNLNSKDSHGTSELKQ